MNKTHYYILLIFSITLSISCNKSKFLDKKPDEKLIIPTTLEDYQSILDYHVVINGETDGGPIPSLMQIGCDDYYLAPEYTGFLDQELNYYQWSDNVDWELNDDWERAYRAIFYANAVLDGIPKLGKTVNQTDFNNVKGSALFYRAHIFYQLSQVFAPVYNNQIAESDWGIPLRLKSDIGEKLQRATLAKTYNQILNDLKEAKQLLPELPLIKTRPSVLATDALIARVYLSMSQYDSSYKYADFCIPKIENTLIDFSTLDQNSLTPFKRFNSEVIFESVQNNSVLTISFLARVDSSLYDKYAVDDLRGINFFGDGSLVGTSGHFFKGSYFEQNDFYFTGIAADEVFLIRAECNARLGNIDAAMKDLNDLLRTRWKKENGITIYVDQTAADEDEALNKILLERRKELLFRSLRWTDLRRLNKDGADISITRIVNGQTYTLAPDDKRYTYLIPSDVINFHPDMPQNPR